MPAKRCPMCHRASSGHAWQCECGYEFGQSPERVVEMLRAQYVNGWIALAMLLVVDAAALGGVMYAAFHGWIVFSALGVTALTLATARTVRRLLITRASLRMIAQRAEAVPRAIVHRR